MPSYSSPFLCGRQETLLKDHLLTGWQEAQVELEAWKYPQHEGCQEAQLKEWREDQIGQEDQSQGITQEDQALDQQEGC